MLNQTSHVTMFTTHFSDLCNCYDFTSQNSIPLFNDFKIFKYSGLFDYLFIRNSIESPHSDNTKDCATNLNTTTLSKIKESELRLAVDNPDPDVDL